MTKISDYEIKKWTRILEHPSSSPAQKAEARQRLGIAEEPEPEPYRYDSALDGEVESFFVGPRPEHSYEDDGPWPPPNSPAGKAYWTIHGTNLLGGWEASAPEDLKLCLSVQGNTNSTLIRHQAREAIDSCPYFHKNVIPQDLYETARQILTDQNIPIKEQL